MSARDRAGEGAEVWAFSAQTCCRAWCHEQQSGPVRFALQKALSGRSWALLGHAEGTWVPMTQGVAPASEPLFSGTASEGCGRHG